MKKLILVSSLFAVSLISACGGSDSGDTTPQAATSYKFGEYFPLEVPASASSCTVTKEVVAGTGVGTTATYAFDSNMETIDYLSGSLSGTVVTDDGGNSIVYYNDGATMKILRYQDSILSTDCSLSAHPDAFSFGPISDGMIKSISNFSTVSKSNPVDCVSVPNATDLGNKALYRIVDVTVRNTNFKNAIIEYWLDLDIPWVPLQYTGNYGIPLPSSSETQGNSITDISIYAFGEGEVAHLGVDASTGNINETVERTGFACQ